MKMKLKYDLCMTCGCPRIVHKDDGECIHCLAYSRPQRCKEYIPKDEEYEFVTVNTFFLQEILIILWAGGFSIGIGLLWVVQDYSSGLGALLVGVGLFLTIVGAAVLPSRPSDQRSD